MAKTKWLSFYAEHFDTVEINNTFYHLPKASTFESWREQVPAGLDFFLFRRRRLGGFGGFRFLLGFGRLFDSFFFLRLFFFWGRFGGLPAFANYGNVLADGYACAFLREDFQKRSGRRRLILHGRLVGLNLAEDVALLDCVAFILDPLDDDAFFHGRRQGQHGYILSHCSVP